MQRQNLGERLGRIDSDGIAEWYPNCKVRFDGSHYIAIPHTTNTARRTVRKEEKIFVSEQDGKYTLKETAENTPAMHESVAVEEVIADKEKRPPDRNGESKNNVRSVTRKQLFDELYDKYIYLKPKERRQAICADMKDLFQSEMDLETFIDKHCNRRWRNLVVRRQRFTRKAYNQRFRYFVTFTYSDEKHTEESFKKRLLETLRRFSTRHNWKYMGVWEHGGTTNRLHFHCLLSVPDGKMVGELAQTKDYNKKTGRQETILQNSFFAEKFGRNEFDEIGCSAIEYGRTLAYLMKYMEKQNAKAVYSRGLYQYFRSDIQGSDVLVNANTIDETDNRLILADDFTCIDEGEFIGKVSEETIAKLPKSV